MDFNDLFDMLSSQRRREQVSDYQVAVYMRLMSCLSFFFTLITSGMGNLSSFRWIFAFIGTLLFICYISIFARRVTTKHVIGILLSAAAWLFLWAWLFWSWISLIFILLGALAVAVAVRVIINSFHARNSRKRRGGYRW